MPNFILSGRAMCVHAPLSRLWYVPRWDARHYRHGWESGQTPELLETCGPRPARWQDVEEPQSVRCRGASAKMPFILPTRCHLQAPVAAPDTTACLASRVIHSLQRAVAAPILLAHQHAEQGPCQHALTVLERGGRGDGHIQSGRALCQPCGAGSQLWKRCALSE